MASQQHNVEAVTNTGAANEAPDKPTHEQVMKASLPDVEDVHDYAPGRHHPVNLGDILNGHFEIVHKLGHGGFGIVWLCLDASTNEWRAVKIITAEDSGHDFGDLHLANKLREKGLGPAQWEAACIALPLDNFWLEGPNGRHLCLVLPLLGPSIDSLKRSDAALVKKLIWKAAQGLHFLHGRGICHGDVRPNNILLRVKDTRHITKENMVELLGEPTKEAVQTNLFRHPGSSYPEYIIRPANLSRLGVMNKPVIIDFGEAFPVNEPPEEIGIPIEYVAPEARYGTAPNFSSDIWALGCTIAEMRIGRSLLGDKDATYIANLEVLLGPMPEPYRSGFLEMLKKTRDEEGEDLLPAWGKEVSNQDGALASLTPREDYEQRMWSLEKCKQETGFKDPICARLAHEQHWFEWPKKPDGELDLNADTQKVKLKVPDEEVLILGDLLKNIFRYDPKDRLSIDGVLTHQWLSVSTVDESGELIPGENDSVMDLDCEPAREYCIGGYHPVNLYDVIHERFEIVHKLGHGGFATVWLCWDRNNTSNPWKAVKIIKAHKSHKKRPEISLMEAISDGRYDRKEWEAAHLVLPLEHFWLQGPNGRHLCEVMEVIGPDLRCAWDKIVRFAKPALVKKLFYQAGIALRFLHSQEMCHGDFRTGNLLVRVQDISKVTKAQMKEILGRPKLEDVCPWSKRWPGPDAPCFLVAPANLSKLELSHDIAVIDFGATFEEGNPPLHASIPRDYAPPEALFRYKLGRSIDVWSLACTILEVRTKERIFGYSTETYVEMLEATLGPIPLHLRVAYLKAVDDMFNDGIMSERPQLYDKMKNNTDALKYVTSSEKEISLQKELGRVEKENDPNNRIFLELAEERVLLSVYDDPDDDKNKKVDQFHFNVPDEEARILGDLLTKMIKYDPEERLDISGVLEHEWFKGRQSLLEDGRSPPAATERNKDLEQSRDEAGGNTPVPDTLNTQGDEKEHVHAGEGNVLVGAESEDNTREGRKDVNFSAETSEVEISRESNNKPEKSSEEPTSSTDEDWPSKTSS
ncbi:kinase-like domain-containing protein [Xylariaceae sp. AK1471]|nr:kinase-like domain-containing protein [Xylariaceae sp. AK1471]